jgi:hypothetical protein
MLDSVALRLELGWLLRAAGKLQEVPTPPYFSICSPRSHCVLLSYPLVTRIRNASRTHRH